MAADAGKQVMVNARGNPAEIIALGIAVGVVVIAVGVGYGVYKGSQYLFKNLRLTQ